MGPDRNSLIKANNEFVTQDPIGQNHSNSNRAIGHKVDSQVKNEQIISDNSGTQDPRFLLKLAQQQQMELMRKQYQDQRMPHVPADQMAAMHPQNVVADPAMLHNLQCQQMLNNMSRNESRNSNDAMGGLSHRLSNQVPMEPKNESRGSEHLVRSPFVAPSPKLAMGSGDVIFQNPPVSPGMPSIRGSSANLTGMEGVPQSVAFGMAPQQNPLLFQMKTEAGSAPIPAASLSTPQNISSSVGGSVGNNPLSSPTNVLPQFMPNQNQQNAQLDALGIQQKIAVILNQMNQIQSTVMSINASQHPQAAQLLQFLTNRWQALKNLYQQLLLQQQQLRMVMPTQGGIPQLPQHLVNNHNAFAALQQQMALRGQLSQAQMMGQVMSRPNVMPNAFQMRQGMPMNPSMMPPGLSRFQGPRPGFPQPGFYPGGAVPRMQSAMDTSRSRRGGVRGNRRRRRYSTESEEEENMSSSEVESIPSGVLQDIPLEESELRRSSRKHTVKSYTQEFPDDSESEEKSKKDNDSVGVTAQDLIPLQPTEQVEGKIMLIEKILSDRLRPAEEDDDETLVVDGNVEEYYIKFKCYSYLHCEWCSVNDLKRRDRNALSKIKRYKIKKQESPFLYIDEDPFNPDYVEIDRILDMKKTPDPINPEAELTCFLVKWCALPYDESTWEFEDVVDETAIEDFHRREAIPPPESTNYRPKPTVSQWHKIQTSPVYKNENSLRDYQLEGINWLLYEYYAGTNCILADEMGLGKTIQSIAFLVEVCKMGYRGPFLIIAPLSTIGNWYREFQSWSEFNVVVFHGTASSRNIIHRYELFYRNEDGSIVPEICKFEVLITTYEMILAENKFLSNVRWRIAIVDEAHRLKNRNCKLLENLSQLHIEHRVLLTGTPLQNTFEELLSLLNFLDPIRAVALEQIVKTSGKLETNVQVQQIQAFLKPVILRRLKEDVEKNIAPKEETIIEVELTWIQKKVYRGILERNLSFLTRGTTSSNLPNLMNVMMELRKCCNHPFLINGVEDKILNEYSSAHPELDKRAIFGKALVESSGKLVLVDKLLPKLRQSGHKMLIFSQMVRVLDLIEEYLVTHNFTFERIDGSVRGNLRQAAIDRFSRPDSDRSVFLLCTKAGGLGINLTAADTVIIFDSDWNPQNDIQAQARCHRIGQSKAVKVYRLICRKTYEREMFDRASLKLGLDKAVLQDINCSSDARSQLNPRTQLSKSEVEELLRKGAYAAVMDEDIDASARFCSEDIDQILERRATVVQIAGATRGSSFAKASFNAEVSSEQVDIDDPDFWQKWAKSAKVNTTAVGDFVDDKPRVRKQVHQIDTDPEVEYNNLLSEEEEFRHVRQVTPQSSWQKKECLKVEKNLLVYGWGRWSDILKAGAFKTSVTLRDVEQISKTILIIIWHACKPDSTYNDFVEKAIRMTTIKHRQDEVDSEDYNYKPYTKRTRGSKHSRSHKRKSDKLKICLIQAGSDWRNLDIDTLVLDSNYKKHLQHCATKILIRLRLLFIIEFYILRELKEEIMMGVHVDELDLKLPSSAPAINFPSWWNDSCGKSLVVGTFKHGYERYAAIKSDKQLSFAQFINSNESKSDSADVAIKRRGRKKKLVVSIASDEDDMNDTIMLNETEQGEESPPAKTGEMPTQGECNTYLKKLVLGYWKTRMKSLSKTDNRNRGESAKRWTRKEEAEVYKALITFGFERSENTYEWKNFRTFAKLEKKDDAALTTFVDNLLLRCNELVNNYVHAVDKGLEAIASEGSLTLEKADKILRRVEFFCLIRAALAHPELEIKIQAAPLPGSDILPEWWSHQFDLDLLKGFSLHGLEQSDRRLFDDQSLAFHKIVRTMRHNYLHTAVDGVPSDITDCTNSDDITTDMLKAIVHWPKQRVLLNRVYGLVMLVLHDTWCDKYDKENTLKMPKKKDIADPPMHEPNPPTVVPPIAEPVNPPVIIAPNSHMPEAGAVTED